MRKSEAETLNRFLDAVASMHVHSTEKLGAALKKPLLLLLVISRIAHGGANQNHFHFSDIRGDLANLIHRYGGRPTGSGAKPEQPFTHLRSCGFWRLVTQREYRARETALVSDLLHRGSYAALEPEVFRLLRYSKEARAQAFQRVLEQWWPETIHDEIRDELEMESFEPVKPRNARFVDDVLANYRFSCSFCGFHAILNRQAIGVDACHIRWRSANGPDVAGNGIALCKLHHWAFDKGVMTLDSDLTIRTAPDFVIHSDGGLPLHSLSGKPLTCPPRGDVPGEAYLKWHRGNVFLG